jgi:hypothetical protein
MSVVRFLELIAKIVITKIVIAKIGITIGMDRLNWDPDQDGLLKLGSNRTITSRECEPTAHNRLAHHRHCDRLAMPTANRPLPLQSNTFSPTAHHVITTVQHHHFGHSNLLRTSWSLKCHPCMQLYSMTILKISPLSSLSQKGVTIAKIWIAKIGIANGLLKSGS